MDRPVSKPMFKYMFTMTADVDAKPLGDAPGGFRVDLAYTNGRAFTRAANYCSDWLSGIDLGDFFPKNGKTTEAEAYERVKQARQAAAGTGHGNGNPLQAFQSRQTLEWFGFEGSFLRGGDWAIMRSDGVGQFSGRITLRSDDPDGAVVDAHLTGLVDLRLRRAAPAPVAPGEKAGPQRYHRHTNPIGDGSVLYNAWRNGSLESAPGELYSEIPLCLAVSFESAVTKAESWAPDKLKKQTAGAWKLLRLVRGQFVAIGTARLSRTRYSRMEQIELNVCEVMPVLPDQLVQSTQPHPGHQWDRAPDPAPRYEISAAPAGNGGQTW
jgi:hypothetical protein